MSSRQPPPLLQPVDEELWYYGEVSRKDVEQLLVKDGDYLIRLNRDRGYILSMKWQGGPKHFVVQTTDDNPVGGREREGECVSERETRGFGYETDPVVGCSPNLPPQCMQERHYVYYRYCIHSSLLPFSPTPGKISLGRGVVPFDS